jgi:hypothetical protein
MRRQAQVCVIALLVFGAATADDKASPGFVTTMYFQTGAGADAHGYCGQCVLHREGVPVACFGLNKRPGEKTRYAYLLLFKAPGAKPAGGLRTDGKSQGTNFNLDLDATLTFNGKKVAVGYRFTADEKTNKLTSEAVKLGGKEIRPDAPRIYLVDLTRREITFVPVKVDVAVEAPDLTDSEHKTWAKSVDQLIEQLKEKSPEVKKFLK